MSKEQLPIDKETYDLISANFRRDFPGDIKMNEWSIYKKGATSVLNQKKEPVLRWVNGAERLPDDNRQYHARINFVFQKDPLDCIIHRKGNIWTCWGSETWTSVESFKIIEWLEETESIPSSLPDADK
jgi:hypothetical protein